MVEFWLTQSHAWIQDGSNPQRGKQTPLTKNMRAAAAFILTLFWTCCFKKHINKLYILCVHNDRVVDIASSYFNYLFNRDRAVLTTSPSWPAPCEQLLRRQRACVFLTS